MGKRQCREERSSAIITAQQQHFVTKIRILPSPDKSLKLLKQIQKRQKLSELTEITETSFQRAGNKQD